MKKHCMVIALGLLCAGAAASLAAPDPVTAHFSEVIRYPADAGVINVKEAPYHARGDGITDDTRAIQAAIRDHMRGGILYFPHGTYLVSDTLRWSKQDSEGRECWGNFTLQGESTRGTVIRLKDGVFTDAKAPRTIMWCGGFGSADWFHNYVRNITFNAGKGNPGAIGLQFYSNNSGGVRDVAIRSEDGLGVAGLDLGHRNMNGPLLVNRVLVEGFEVGLKTGHSVNSQVFEHVRLRGQSDVGLQNDGQSLSIRGLQVEGAPRAVRNQGPGGFLTLIDSQLQRDGAPAGAAIENHSPMFLRNVLTRGFAQVVDSKRGVYEGGARVEEFVTEPVLRLFDGADRSMNLPIKETPHVPLAAPETWVNVRTFHKGGEDYSAAIQAAIDSGATTVYFPRGAYKIGETVRVRGKVTRLVGMNSWFAEAPSPAFETNPRFRVEEGTAPVVVVENFCGGFGGRPFIDYAANRALVVRQSSGIPSFFRGSGEIFIEDITGSPGGVFVLEGNQRVWARQFNVEAHVNPLFPSTLENRGSQLWVLGLKTEQGNRLLATRQGGKTEVLGGLVYTVTDHEGRPAFINEESSLSLTLLERCFTGKPMNPVVEETRNGITRTLGKNSVIGLYVGWGATSPGSEQSAPGQ